MVYKMKVAGVERDLPLCPISDTLDIAGFVMFGDVEITEAAAKALMEKCPEHDIIITAAAATNKNFTLFIILMFLFFVFLLFIIGNCTTMCA